jgi:hypothetical protein
MLHRGNHIRAITHELDAFEAGKSIPLSLLCLQLQSAVQGRYSANQHQHQGPAGRP